MFLFDFDLELKRAPSERGYFVHGGGWLDLLGSIQSLGVFRFTALFMLARLSRSARTTTLLGGQSKRQLMREILQSRGRSAQHEWRPARRSCAAAAMSVTAAARPLSSAAAAMTHAGTLTCGRWGDLGEPSE